jgi:hypothetical protein
MAGQHVYARANEMAYLFQAVDRQHKIELSCQVQDLPMNHVQIQIIFDSSNPSIDETPSSVHDIDPDKI